jgi:hypothetical protein
MNTRQNSIRLNAIALALAGITLSTSALAGNSWCLSRGEGEGLHYLNAESITDPKEWISQGALLVHTGTNQPECAMLGASCNVSPGDMITVSQNLQGDLILHRTRPTGRPVVRDIARMTLDPSGRFLSGFSEGSDRAYGQQVFLYYTGTGHCTDSGMDYAPDALCRSFTFEAFPTGVSQDHRPDASFANWQSSDCPTVAQQPGQGSTNEPPQPPP